MHSNVTRMFFNVTRISIMKRDRKVVQHTVRGMFSIDSEYGRIYSVALTTFFNSSDVLPQKSHYKLVCLPVHTKTKG